MKHIRAINQKAVRIESHTRQEREAAAIPNDDSDVVALESGQPQGPHIPLGCSLVFSPGWRWTRAAAPRAFASPWSATSSTATTAASGRSRCRIT